MISGQPRTRSTRGRVGALSAAGAVVLGAAVALAYGGASEGRARAAPPAATGSAPTADGSAPSLASNAQRGEVVPPGLDQVEQMCVLLTSCDKLPIPPSLVAGDVPSCVKKMTDEMASPGAVAFSLTMRECGLHSMTCAGLRSCALRGAASDACVGRGRQNVVGFCDVDGRALTCWHDQVLAVRECPRGGEQCVVVDGQATCTLGPCPAAFAASKDGDKPRCSGSGTHILHCEKGKLASLDCAAFGLRCATSSDGSAGCATTTPACSGDTRRCDGSTSVGCFNGHEVRVECGAAGMSCRPGGGGTGGGGAAGAATVGACAASPVAPGGGAPCDVSERARCEDGNIRYCFAGSSRQISCKALGFARCDAARGPHCSP